MKQIFIMRFNRFIDTEMKLILWLKKAKMRGKKLVGESFFFEMKQKSQSIIKGVMEGCAGAEKRYLGT